MTKLDLNKIMAAKAGDREEHLHVQISKVNKRFLRASAKDQGVKMGLYLDKLLSAMRTNGSKT